MEEQQIRSFVHRVSQDETLRQELVQHPGIVIEREQFSPRVARVVMRLIPHLTLDHPTEEPSLHWWL